MLGAGLDAGGEAQHLAGVEAGGGGDVGDTHLARGDGAGLVHDHRVHLAGGFEHFGALNQQPQLCAAAGAHQDRRGGGQAECARARDDEHGHRRGERMGGAVAH